MSPRGPALAFTRSPAFMWTVWLATRAAGVTILVTKVSGYPDVAGDVRLYARYGQLWSRGLMPYRDFHLEYPPGVLPLLRLPGTGYVGTFLVCALLADAVTQRSLWAARSTWGTRLWLVAPIAVGPIFWARFDIFVAALLVGGLLAARHNRWMLAGACLSYAGMIKIWPLGLACLALALAPAARRARCFVGVGLVFVALSLPVVLVGGSQGLQWMFRYQAGHGIEIESLPAAPLEFMALLGRWTPIGAFHGTAEYAPAPAVVRVLSAVFTLLLGLGAVGLGTWILRRTSARAVTLEAALIGCIVVLFLTSKILSAQYALWALAAVAVSVDLVPQLRRRLLAECTVMLLASTQLMYPFAFLKVPTGLKAALLVALLHAAVVVGLCAQLIRELGFLSSWPAHSDVDGAVSAPMRSALRQSSAEVA